MWRRRRPALLALLLAACQPARIPDGAPEAMLESVIEQGADPGRPPALQRCLFVLNHTADTVAIFVDGRHAGWLGPKAGAGFYVGRGASTSTQLRATCDRGVWKATLKAPVWNKTWHLR